MDRAEQAEGEKRVMELLIEPLLRLGLKRPSGSTVANFEQQKREVCAKLAYMSPTNLETMVGEVAALATGPNRDHLPIAKTITNRAFGMQEPVQLDAPLMRSFFNHVDGRQAYREGWGPEALQHLRKARAWPGRYALSKIRDDARHAIRRMETLERFDVADLNSEDRAWLRARQELAQRCAELVALGEAGQ